MPKEPLTLKQYLRESGQTQAVFASKVGVGKPYLSELVNGLKRPSLKVAQEIERATRGRVPARIWPTTPTQEETHAHRAPDEEGKAAA